MEKYNKYERFIKRRKSSQIFIWEGIILWAICFGIKISDVCAKAELGQENHQIMTSLRDNISSFTVETSWKEMKNFIKIADSENKQESFINHDEFLWYIGVQWYVSFSEVPRDLPTFEHHL